MEFGIKYVTVCACDWLINVFLYQYSVYGMSNILIIWIFCDVCNWHCLESRDGFYPVDNSREFLEASVSYYPVAHRGHFGVNLRVLKIATCPSPRVHTNQSVTGNQGTTVILK